MNLSQVSIDRPILASVFSLLIVLFGAVALARLPNRELPDIDPPIVSVTTIFPGAAPEVVETSVTQPLEDSIIGIDGVKHVTSISREQVSQITIEFDLAKDVEAGAADVRDRVARVRSALPDEVESPVVAKRDSDANAVVWIALSGEAYDQVQLTSLAETQLKDRLGKLPGVASIIIGGERRYAMRLWIDNERLTAHNLTIADVNAALQRENVDIPSGRVEGTDREFTVRSLGELNTVEEYENLIVAAVADVPVRLGEVAEIEVGPEDERKLVRFNGASGIGLGIVKQSKANTLTVAESVKAELEELKQIVPSGVKLEIAFDSSAFIRRSIEDVTQTIFEAIGFVVIVIYLFLRSARATVVPALAIPVSIVGTFAFLYFFGFSINTLTLMGVTLAIGLVVDDAIVVLENITRWVEQGIPPMEAARRGMAEISFAVVAATVSAVTVFLPLTFLTDTTGRLFREFAVTVAAAVAISGFVALTLSPALSARLVRPPPQEHAAKRALKRAVDGMTRGYGILLRRVLLRPALWVGVGGIWLAFGIFLYGRIPEELMPEADRSLVFVRTEAPEGSTIEYTDRYQRQVEAIVSKVPEIRRVLSVVAVGIGTPGVVNEGFVINSLVPSEERNRSQNEIIAEIGRELWAVPGVKAFAFGPSPLQGFASPPVQMVIQGDDVRELARLSDDIAAGLRAHGGFENIRSDLFLNKPQLEVAIDRERASDLGVSARDIATTLQVLLGGLDLTSFKLEGETYNVMAQLRRRARARPRDLLQLNVRGRGGALIPLASVVSARETVAPRSLPHFDRLRSATLTAYLDELSQGEALEVVRQIAADVLPSGYRVVFSGDSERFFESGNALLFAYGLAIVIVYLVLAAQFESFVHPLVILVAVALSFTGALSSLYQTGESLNLYSKIGLIMLVGLVTKNSILIVEFANQLRGRGVELYHAIFEASTARFRPILMTALATMVGILPIALGRGAGGEARAPLGIAVVGGMLFSTILTFFVVPATYVAIEGLRSARVAAGEAADDAGAEPVAKPVEQGVG